MIELIVLWIIAIALIVSVGVQISDYKKRKEVNAAIQGLQRIIKGESNE